MDTYDLHNPLNPINEIEVDAEIVESELEIANQLNHILSQRLKNLAEIERCLSVFGTLTYEQLKQKKEILNRYEKRNYNHREYKR